MYRYLKLNFADEGGGVNEVDAAAQLRSKWVSSKHGDFFTIDPNPIEYSEGLTVMKVGRTTGFTNGGIIDGIAGEFPASVDLGGGVTKQAYFVNQIAMYQQGQPFSAAGDSGSLVVDVATKRPVGLLFSGNDQADSQGRFYSYANPIASVMKAAQDIR